MSEVRQRRNHAVAGIGVLLGAALASAGVTQPLMEYSTAAFDVSVFRALNLGLKPSLPGSVDDQSGILLLALCGVAALMGLLLLVTRVRYLGVMWRVIAIAAFLLPAWCTFVWWRWIRDPMGFFTSADMPEPAKWASRLPETLGVLKITPELGIYLLSVGLLIGLISTLVPAIRSSVPSGHGKPALGTASTPLPPPGWYQDPSGSGSRWWDGNQWTDHRS